MKPCGVYWSSQMNPTTASDSTTGMKKRALVEPRATHLSVEQDREEDADRASR